MIQHPLDFNTRKTLCVHLGDAAGKAIADLVLRMATRIEALERGKVDVTPIISNGAKRPSGSAHHTTSTPKLPPW